MAASSRAVAYRGVLSSQKVKLGGSDEKADKWVPMSASKLTNAKECEGSELWVLRVPMDFEANALDGQVVSHTAVNSDTAASSKSRPGAAPSKLLFSLLDESLSTYECRADSGLSGVMSQLRCMVQSGEKSNGVQAGPQLVRGFDVVQVPEEEASENEEEAFEAEEERQEKMKEVVAKLVVAPRPQVKLVAKFSHLGDKKKTLAKPQVKRAVEVSSSPVKKKKRKSKDRDTPSKKDKKRRRVE